MLNQSKESDEVSNPTRLKASRTAGEIESGSQIGAEVSTRKRSRNLGGWPTCSAAANPPEGSKGDYANALVRTATP